MKKVVIALALIAGLAGAGFSLYVGFVTPVSAGCVNGICQ